MRCKRRRSNAEMRIPLLALLLSGCVAMTEQEQLDHGEAVAYAKIRYTELQKVCQSIGLTTAVDCDAGHYCWRHPNTREMRTAYCRPYPSKSDWRLLRTN